MRSPSRARQSSCRRAKCRSAERLERPSPADWLRAECERLSPRFFRNASASEGPRVSPIVLEPASRKIVFCAPLVEAETASCLFTQTSVPATVAISSSAAVIAIPMVLGSGYGLGIRMSLRSWELSSVSAFPHFGQTKPLPFATVTTCNQSATWQFPKLVHLPRRVPNLSRPLSHTACVCRY